MVKPEKSTLYVAAGTPAKLRVWVQNNFDVRLMNVQMQGVAGGYTITVGPAGQNIWPGQNVGFLFTISGPAGNVSTTTLNLQVKFRTNSGTWTWAGGSSATLNQSPSQASLASGTQSAFFSGPGDQSNSMFAGTLADKFGNPTLSAASPFFGRTAVQQLVKWFGYRFCYSSSGGWRSGAADCPSPTAEGAHWSGLDQFPQDCMRAGVELAILKARGKLGSDLAAAQAGAANALGGTGTDEHKCLAAVVGGYLYQGASSTTAFTTALAAAGNAVPPICQAAGLRALGTGPAGTCSGAYYEEAACAAAEGLAGNDAPVKSILLPSSGDGESSGNSDSLYYSYLLAVVTGHRSSLGGAVSYYPDAGAPTGDGPLVTPDTTVKPPDQAVKKDTTVKPPDQAVKKDTTVKPPDQAVKKDTGKPTADQAVKKDTGKPAGDLTPTETAPKVDTTAPVTEAGGRTDGKLATEAGGPKDKLDGGCGCAVATHGATPLGGLALLLVIGFLCTRRRRP